MLYVNNKRLESACMLCLFIFELFSLIFKPTSYPLPFSIYLVFFTVWVPHRTCNFNMRCCVLTNISFIHTRKATITLCLWASLNPDHALSCPIGCFPTHCHCNVLYRGKSEGTNGISAAFNQKWTFIKHLFEIYKKKGMFLMKRMKSLFLKKNMLILRKYIGIETNQVSNVQDFACITWKPSGRGAVENAQSRRKRERL